MSGPSWLAEEPAAPASPTAENVADTIPASSSTDHGSTATPDVPPSSKGDVDRVKWVKRLSNMVISSACVTRAVLIILTIPKDISQLVIASYSAFLCTFVFLSEMTELKFMKWILSNHGYLYSPVMRFLFYLLLGSMQWSLGGLWSFVNGGALIVVAFFNAYWLVMYPSLRVQPQPKPSSAPDPSAETDVSAI